MSTDHYFESVGVWPARSEHMTRTYVIGYGASLVLTLIAYALVVYHLAPGYILVPAILVLAGIQFLVQVLNFLHVSTESHSRERLVILACAALIMLIVIIGSMWIIANLNTRMAPVSGDAAVYMEHEGGF